MADGAEQNPTIGSDSGESRRQALTKIGVGAAVVWAAPLVTTIPGSAAAVGSTPTSPTTTTSTTSTTTTPTTTTTTTTPPALPEPDFAQPVSSLGTRSVDDSNQIWQPIVAGRTGSLERVALWGRDGGDPLLVTVHEVDASGRPGAALGSGRIDPSVPATYSERIVELSPPVPVIEGERYVLVITKSDPSTGFWILSFGPLVPGFPYSIKFSYSTDPNPAQRTLYVKTYVV